MNKGNSETSSSTYLGNPRRKNRDQIKTAPKESPPCLLCTRLHAVGSSQRTRTGQITPDSVSGSPRPSEHKDSMTSIGDFAPDFRDPRAKPRATRAGAGQLGRTDRFDFIFSSFFSFFFLPYFVFFRSGRRQHNPKISTRSKNRGTIHLISSSIFTFFFFSISTTALFGSSTPPSTNNGLPPCFSPAIHGSDTGRNQYKAIRVDFGFLGPVTAPSVIVVANLGRFLAHV